MSWHEHIPVELISCENCDGFLDEFEFRENVGECADIGADSDTGCAYQPPDHDGTLSLHSPATQHIRAWCSLCGETKCIPLEF